MAFNWQDFLFGGTRQVGSPSDVTMLNQDQYNQFMRGLGGAMGGFQQGMGSNLGQAGTQLGNLAALGQGFGTQAGGYQGAAGGFGSTAAQQLANVAGTAGQYTDFLSKMYGGAAQAQGAEQAAQAGMGGAAGAAGQQFGNVAQTAGNLQNFINQQGAQYGNLAQATGNFNPTAAMNQYLSTQPALSQLAGQNVSQALSDVYSTGRQQATAAADEARRQAAGQLANAGLLQSGSAVRALTEATARPQMEMETQLAGMRSQALQNQLGQLQGQTGSMLGQGYGTAAQLAGQAQANQLAAAGQQGQLYQAAGQGQQALANLYGQQALGQAGLAQGYTQGALGGAQGLTGAYQGAGNLAGNLYGTAGNLGANYAGMGADALNAAARGYSDIGGQYANLYSQGQQIQGQLNQPQYYVPQYERTGGALDVLGGLGSAAMGIGSLMTGGAGGAGLGALGGLLSGLFQPQYTPYQEPGWWAQGGGMNTVPAGYQNQWAASARMR